MRHPQGSSRSGISRERIPELADDPVRGGVPPASGWSSTASTRCSSTSPPSSASRRSCASAARTSPAAAPTPPTRPLRRRRCEHCGKAYVGRPASADRSTAPRLPRHRLEHCSSVTRGLPRNGPNCARDVARLGRRHGFGFVGEKAGRSRQLMSGDRAAAYLWSYSVRGTGSKATLQENARNPHLPRMLIWVSPRLTRPSGVTMRNLRRCRQLWAVRRGLLPPPSWSAVEFARIVNLAGPWPARGRKSPRCRGDRLRVVRRRAGKSGRRRSSA